MTNKNVILISGGSEGLGYAIAEKFSKIHTVIILARNAQKTKKAAKELGCDFVIADVSDTGQVARAVSAVIKKHKKIDYLVNNAGLWIEGPLEKNNPKRIKEVIDVNTTGTILLTRSVLPYMRARKRGRIIMVNSQSGFYGKGERSVYNASKWAITGFTKSLQMELAGSAITVTGFYPGSMKTKLFEKAGIKKDTSKAMTVADAVRAVQFILETPDDLAIPEISIKPTYY